MRLVTENMTTHLDCSDFVRLADEQHDLTVRDEGNGKRNTYLDPNERRMRLPCVVQFKGRIQEV